MQLLREDKQELEREVHWLRQQMENQYGEEQIHEGTIQRKEPKQVKESSKEEEAKICTSPTPADTEFSVEVSELEEDEVQIIGSEAPKNLSVSSNLNPVCPVCGKPPFGLTVSCHKCKRKFHADCVPSKKSKSGMQCNECAHGTPHSAKKPKLKSQQHQQQTKQQVATHQKRPSTQT